MKGRLRSWILAFAGCALPAIALAETYSVTGALYTEAYAPYTTAMRIVGSFTTDVPLPAGFSGDPGPLGTGVMTSWSFSDGVNIYDQTNSIGLFSLLVDAKGNITAYAIHLYSPGTPHTAGQVLHNAVISTTGTLWYSNAINNLTCSGGSPTPPHLCNGGGGTQPALSTNVAAFDPNFTAVAPSGVMAFHPPRTRPDSVVALRYTLTNADGTVPLTNVAFVDTLPAGVSVATPSGLASTCGGVVNIDPAGPTLSLAGGTIPAGTSCTLEWRVITAGLGTYVNASGDATSAQALPIAFAAAALVVVESPESIPALGAGPLAIVVLLLALGGAASLRRKR